MESRKVVLIKLFDTSGDMEIENRLLNRLMDMVGWGRKSGTYGESTMETYITYVK